MSLISCKKKAQVDDTPLARVGDEILYYSDIQHLLPAELKDQDSLAFVESYIQKWVQDKLMYQKASINLPDNQEDIEIKVENFRQSLLVYKYEQQLIAQKLDRKIAQQDIETFYNDHQNEFILSENIVKPFFMVIPKKNADVSKLTKLLNSKKEDDENRIKDICYQYSNKFYFPTNWMSETEILNEMPNNSISLAGSGGRVIVQSDSSRYFIVKIMESKHVGDVAPIEYVQNDIKQVMLQERTQILSKKIRNKIFEDALNKNLFEIYNK